AYLKSPCYPIRLGIWENLATEDVRKTFSKQYNFKLISKDKLSKIPALVISFYSQIQKLKQTLQ
ncbi:MAG: hypothetical protein NWE80_00670, partial [Candidatus Bathyarchaeota archaeon]|nr:hypothetical protein [Candidatus Bathyarchaeota archaeon]